MDMQPNDYGLGKSPHAEDPSRHPVSGNSVIFHQNKQIFKFFSLLGNFGLIWFHLV